MKFTIEHVEITIKKSVIFTMNEGMCRYEVSGQC